MVGYWIGKEHWGQGIASAALRLYLDDVAQHRPLLASVVEHNAGSRRVLEKAGFQFVGRELAEDGPEPGTFAELHAAGVETDGISENARWRYSHFRMPDGKLYELVEERTDANAA